MQVKVSNNITITDPSPEILAWCKSHLIIPNPDYAKKARMGFWLGNTPKELYLYETHGGNLVLPFGTLREILPMIQGATVQTDFKPCESIDYGEPIPLYPYQEKAVEAVLRAKYGILQAPCGCGKTRCAIEMIRRIGKRALFVTHTAELLNQAKHTAEQFFDKSLIGTITEGKVSIGKGVTFATVQTLSNIDLPLYKDEWEVCICDECHRVCTSAKSVTMFSKVLNNLSAKRKYGLSATVHRADGLIKSTYALLGQVVYSVPQNEIADRTMRVGINPIGTGIGISRECLNTDGILNYTKLITYLSTHDGRNLCIADEIVNNMGKSCLILSDRLDHLESLMRLLPPIMRKEAVMISGKMTTKKGKAEREQVLEDMRSGKKKYLFATYNLCKEGLDIPCLERLFMTTPQKDYAVITQSIGRIARVCEGKAEPIVYDFVDNIGYLVKSYKKRCTTYKKNDCYFVEGDGQNG